MIWQQFYLYLYRISKQIHTDALDMKDETKNR
jgi:hypothetical protein